MLAARLERGALHGLLPKAMAGRWPRGCVLHGLKHCVVESWHLIAGPCGSAADKSAVEPFTWWPSIRGPAARCAWPPTPAARTQPSCSTVHALIAHACELVLLAQQGQLLSFRSQPLPLPLSLPCVQSCLPGHPRVAAQRNSTTDVGWERTALLHLKPAPKTSCHRRSPRLMRPCCSSAASTYLRSKI